MFVKLKSVPHPKAGCYAPGCHNIATGVLWQSGDDGAGLFCHVHLLSDENRLTPSVATSTPQTTVLEEAQAIVRGARNKDYADPLTNHSRTAELWSTFLKSVRGLKDSVTAEDVCFLNILQKISRAMQSVTRDTLVDISGYAHNIEIIEMLRKDPDSWKSDNEGAS